MFDSSIPSTLRPVLAIRRLSPDDWSIWRTLRLAALSDAPEAFGTTLAQWQGIGDRELRWRARLRDVPFNVVALRGESAVGMASGTSPNAGAVELISMWVAPEARGAGAGDIVVREVCGWAAQQRAERVRLRVYQTNEHALRLYQRHGFELRAVVKARSAGRLDELELERVCADPRCP